VKWRPTNVRSYLFLFSTDRMLNVAVFGCINVHVALCLLDNVIYVFVIVRPMYSHCMFMYDYPG
jgi:hypothetical protein